MKLAVTACPSSPRRCLSPSLAGKEYDEPDCPCANYPQKVISTWHCVVLLTKWNISFLWWYTKGLFLVTGHKSSCFRTQTQNHYMKKRKISNVKKEKKKNKQLWAKTLGTDPGSGAACCSCCCCCCCSCNCCCCCICRAWVCWDSAATFPAHWRDLKLWTESSL